MTTKRKTYNITTERQMKLERLAIDLSAKTGKTVKWSELLTFIIDTYAKEAAKDWESKSKLN